MPRDDQAAGHGDNRIARYEQIKTDFARIKEIDEEVKALGDERAKIVKGLEKEAGVNRGALAEIKKLDKLAPATIAKREESRAELYDLIIKPKVDAAEAGQSDE